MIEEKNLARLITALREIEEAYPAMEVSCVIAYPIEDPKEGQVIGLLWHDKDFLNYEFSEDDDGK